MPHHILIADDDKNNQILILNILAEYGGEFKAYSAPNGKLACKLAEAKLPDLILMDWEMPEMSGIEALQYLKQQESTRDIPILMVTALAYAEDLDYAFNAGAVDYIRKPIDKVELVARIRNALRSAALIRQLKAAAAGK